MFVVCVLTFFLSVFYGHLSPLCVAGATTSALPFTTMEHFDMQMLAECIFVSVGMQRSLLFKEASPNLFIDILLFCLEDFMNVQP